MSRPSLRFGIWARVHGSRPPSKIRKEAYDASWERNHAMVLQAEALGYNSTLVAHHKINPHNPDWDQLEAWTAWRRSRA